MALPIVQSVAKKNTVSISMYSMPNVLYESVNDLDLLKSIPRNNHAMLVSDFCFLLLVLWSE